MGASKEQGYWQIPRTTAMMLLATTAVLATLNVLLLKQNRALKSLTVTAAQSKYLSPGDTVPPLHGINALGEEITVDFDTTDSSEFEKTVVLVFSPNCGWCDVNLPNWEAMLDGIDRSRYRVVAVSTDQEGLTRYLMEHDLLNDITLLRQPAPQDQRAYKMHTTPQTLVIGDGGLVEQAWAGAFWPSQQAEVESFFGVELPGLPDEDENASEDRA